MTPDVKHPDGRSTRWDDHRESRRAELVEAAIRAIDAHGPDAGIAEIAEEAGVSKPVLYRFFTDKDDLRTAVGNWGAELILATLAPIVLRDAPLSARVEAACAAYLELIAEHPHVFALLVRRPGGGDPFAGGRAQIAAALSRWLGSALRELGADTGGAEPWAYGLVGQALATGEWWLDRRTMSRKAVSGYLATFVWHAFEGIGREYGVEIDARNPTDRASGAVTPLRKRP